MAADRLTDRLRLTYFASVLVQDPEFFAKIGPGEICTIASQDIAAIRTAFGEKLGYLVWSLSTVAAVRILDAPEPGD
jgi:ATP-binding cassette subfamily B (MDR/TAP) protein 1